MSQIKAMQLALDALEKSVPNERLGDDDYCEIGWKEHADAAQALRDALAEDTLQQHTDAYQEMEQPRPTGERAKLINRLRLGASISRDRRINEDFAAIADNAADMLEADGKLCAQTMRMEDAR
jgi:hypothetical protein